MVKGKLIGLLLGTFLLGYSTNLLVEYAGINEAMAKTISRCDYTQINEGVFPGIGTNGSIKYDKIWEKVLNQGWRFRFKEKTFIYLKNVNKPIE